MALSCFYSALQRCHDACLLEINVVKHTDSAMALMHALLISVGNHCAITVWLPLHVQFLDIWSQTHFYIARVILFAVKNCVKQLLIAVVCFSFFENARMPVIVL